MPASNKLGPATAIHTLGSPAHNLGSGTSTSSNTSHTPVLHFQHCTASRGIGKNVFGPSNKSIVRCRHVTDRKQSCRVLWRVHFGYSRSQYACLPSFNPFRFILTVFFSLTLCEETQDSLRPLFSRS